MPQPKKPAAASRKPAGAAKKPAASRKPATRKPAASAAKPKAKAAPKAVAPKAKPKGAPTSRAARATPPPAKPASVPTSSDELVAHLNALRERLVSSVTLTTDRLQDTVDDAVRRGRMTRKDAEDLLATLVTAGRAQTEVLLADVEQLLGRGPGDAVLRTVDRARRRVGVGAFPILGYDELTAAQITKRLGGLTPAQLRKVRDHERRGESRTSVLTAVARKLG